MKPLLLCPSIAEIRCLMGEDEAPPATGELAAWMGYEIASIGVGPIDAAATTASVLAARRPEACLLIGLAGSFDLDLHPLGSLMRGTDCTMSGVGVGFEPQQQSFRELALPEASFSSLPLLDTEAMTLDVGVIPGFGSLKEGSLLTVCAASANEEEAASRRERFPFAHVEEMEAFAVARAARMHGAAFGCVRAISNPVGDRDHSGWCFRKAMQAIRDFLSDD